jgi:hypothetical protein
MCAGVWPPRSVWGEVMVSWFPGWQITFAWLLAIAVAAAIYFVPVTRLVEVLIRAEITANAE